MSPNSIPRHTKIVATLGPASASLACIKQMILAGVNVFRLNFSHGNHEFHLASIGFIRAATKELGHEVAILADLQGPKIRVGDILGGETQIVAGEEIIITVDAARQGEKSFFTPVLSFAKDVKPGERILIDDGLLELKALRIDNKTDVVCEVIFGGSLKSKKGINLPDTKLSIQSYTDKDLFDLGFIVKQDIDFVALSFVRTVKDLEEFSRAMNGLGRMIPIIAKIEKPEALLHAQDIIDASYGVMIARGDLGVEIPPERVPFEQKRIARYCNKMGKPVIIATQILESMVTKAVPTRAEANDVANAVLDGADALMLSAETASGINPVRCVATMSRIIKTIEDQFINHNQFKLWQFKDYVSTSTPEAVCYGAVKMAIDLNAKVITCVTKTGNTALHLCRHRTSIPILAITDSLATLRKLVLSWGVDAGLVDNLSNTPEGLNQILQKVESHQKLHSKDLIVFTLGLPDFSYDSTNTIRVHLVSKDRQSTFI